MKNLMKVMPLLLIVFGFLTLNMFQGFVALASMWSDMGNWASLHDKLQKDDYNNGAIGNIKLYDCSNCVVHAEDAKKVVLQGLDGYIFSEKNGMISHCKRSEEQRIKFFSTNI